MTATPQIIHASALLGTNIAPRAHELAEQGVASLEVGLPLDPAQGDTPLDRAGAIHRALKTVGISVPVVHAEFGESADLSAKCDSTRSQAIEGHLAALEICATLNARKLVVHAGHHYEQDAQDAHTERAADSVLKLLDPAADYGVTMVIENLPPGHVLDTPEAVREFVQRIGSPKVRACFDSGHAQVTGDPAEAIDVMAPVLSHLHLHDNGGQKDEHLMLGQGVIDWGAVGERLRAHGFDGTALLELRLPEGHTAASMKQTALNLMGYSG